MSEIVDAKVSGRHLRAIIRMAKKVQLWTQLGLVPISKKLMLQKLAGDLGNGKYEVTILGDHELVIINVF